MIERRGIRICKNPDCGAQIVWTVFLRSAQTDEPKLITVSARCLECGTEQRWIQEIETESERAGNELCG